MLKKIISYPRLIFNYFLHFYFFTFLHTFFPFYLFHSIHSNWFSFLGSEHKNSQMRHLAINATLSFIISRFRKNENPFHTIRNNKKTNNVLNSRTAQINFSDIPVKDFFKLNQVIWWRALCIIRTVLYSTVLYVWYSTVQYDTVQYSAVRYYDSWHL